MNIQVIQLHPDRYVNSGYHAVGNFHHCLQFDMDDPESVNTAIWIMNWYRQFHNYPDVKMVPIEEARASHAILHPNSIECWHCIEDRKNNDT